MAAGPLDHGGRPNGGPRALFVSLELLGPVFSGNGVYARSLVRALLTASPPVPVLVLSGRREDAELLEQLASDAGLRGLQSLMASVGQGCGWVDVPCRRDRWGRLDHAGPWHQFRVACRKERVRGAVAAFGPTVAFGVDWSGVLAIHALGRMGAGAPAHPSAPSPPVVYLNFRVYSMSTGLHATAEGGGGGLRPHGGDPVVGVDATEAEAVAAASRDPAAFFRVVECRSAQASTTTVALCRQDALSLHLLCGGGVTGLGHVDPLSRQRYCPATGALLRGGDDHGGEGEDGARKGGVALHGMGDRLRILLPPLRSDVAVLAQAPIPDHTMCTDMTPSHAWLAHLSPSRPVSSLPGARFLACVVRLSPEKAAHRFAAVLQHPALRTALAERGIVPFLCGAAADAAYAAQVQAAVASGQDDSSPGDGVARPHGNPAVIVRAFMSAEDMAHLWRATVLNCHPPDSDAYGMTIVEAAAFGVPSLVHMPPSPSPTSATSPTPTLALTFTPTMAAVSGGAAGFQSMHVHGMATSTLAHASAGCVGRGHVAYPAFPPVGACDLLTPAWRVDGGDAAVADAQVLACDWSAAPGVVAGVLAKLISGHQSDMEGVGHRAQATALSWLERDSSKAMAWLAAGT